MLSPRMCRFVEKTRGRVRPSICFSSCRDRLSSCRIAAGHMPHSVAGNGAAARDSGRSRARVPAAPEHTGGAASEGCSWTRAAETTAHGEREEASGAGIGVAAMHRDGSYSAGRTASRSTDAARTSETGAHAKREEDSGAGTGVAGMDGTGDRSSGRSASPSNRSAIVAWCYGARERRSAEDHTRTGAGSRGTSDGRSSGSATRANHG
jgi:hypothetical protein